MSGPPSPHGVRPEYVPMFHRYQCVACHSWVYYDERIGSWWHMTERNTPKVYNRDRWVIADPDHWQTTNTRSR